MDYTTIDNTNIQEFKISKSAISDGKVIGTCELGKAKIQLLNDNNNYSNYKNRWVKTNFGSFFIYDVEPVQEKVNIKLSCYDIKYKLDVEYKRQDYENLFPCTILEWRNAIAEKCGVRFIDSIFPNSTFILPSHPYVKDGLSSRNVLMMIAEACASFIDNNNDDNLYFYWFSNNPAINIDDWSSLTTEKDSTLPINQVVLGRGDVEDNAAYPFEVANPKILKINNNYILDPQDTSTNDDRRYDMIEPIYNRVNGFKYVIFNMKTQSINTSVKLGDKVSYVDNWGNQLESYVMSVSRDFLGGDLDDLNNWEIEISAEEIKETNNAYSYSGGIMQQLSNLSIKVDKENEIIQSLNQKVIELVRTVHGQGTLKLNETASIGVGKIRIWGDISLLYPTADKQTIDLFPDNNLYPSNELYPNKKNASISRIYPNANTFSKSNKLVLFNDKESIEYKIPLTYLRYLDADNYDELDYENNSWLLIRRIGINEDGSMFVLDKAKKYQLGTQDIALLEDITNVKLESFPNAIFEIKYMLKNDLTNTYATIANLSSEIKQAKDSILVQVKQETDSKVDNKSIIASINTAIKDRQGIIEFLANTLLIKSDNFNLDKNGNVTLASGAKIIGGDGLLTNLQFTSDGEFENYSLLGFKNYYGAGSSIQNSDVSVEVDIPDNFVVESAYLTFYHSPINWSYYNENSQQNEELIGYSRSISLYKVINNANYIFHMAAASEYYTDISNMQFKELQYFGDLNNVQAGSIASYKSNDLKEELKNPGKYKLVLRTKNISPSNAIDAEYQTGACRAVVNVVGYMNFKK